MGLTIKIRDKYRTFSKIREIRDKWEAWYYSTNKHTRATSTGMEFDWTVNSSSSRSTSGSYFVRNASGTKNINQFFIARRHLKIEI